MTGEPTCTEGGKLGSSLEGPYPPQTTSTFVYAKKVTDVAFPEGTTGAVTGDFRIATATEYRFDSQGNPIRTVVTMTSTDGAAEFEKQETTTDSVYGEGAQLLSIEARRGKPTSTTVTTRRVLPVDSNNAPKQHVTTFEYDYSLLTTPAMPQPLMPLPLAKRKVEPGRGAPLEVHSAYAYDFRGNVTATTDCQGRFDDCRAGAQNAAGEANPQFRTVTVSYDPSDFNAPQGSANLQTSLAYADPDQKGRFPVRSANELGHTEFMAYEVVRGNLLQKTAVDGLHACYQYDPFGRKRVDIQRCGSARELRTTVDYHVPPAPDPTTAIITVTRPPGGGATWAYSDVLGRLRKSRMLGFSGTVVEMGSSTYDAEGRLETETKPRTEGEGSLTVTRDYNDNLGRLRSTTQELGIIDGTTTAARDVITYSYSRMSITTTRVVGSGAQQRAETRTETKNVAGKVASVTANGERISYKYDADSNLTEVCTAPPADPSGPCPSRNLIIIGYDDRGRKTSANDPNMGPWEYGYNGFGDLTRQTDAKGQVTNITYDVLGRMVSREVAGQTTNWVYDSAEGAGRGKLFAVASAPDSGLLGTCAIPGIPSSAGQRAVKTLKYNSVGEVEEVVECVDGTSYNTNYGYDTAGRQSVVTYPQVGASRLGVRQQYTSTGHLHYVADVADGMIYWAARAVNALGQVTEEYTRNGVATVRSHNKATGWLMGSTSTAHGDSNRIIQQWGYTFDEAGNLVTRSRSDQVVTANSVETFTYDAFHRLRSSQVQIPSQSYESTETFEFDRLGNMTAKNGAGYSYTGCSAGGRPAGPNAVCSVAGSPFVYDLNGNMTSGQGRQVTYNAINKPSSITHAGTTVEYVYGADGDRVVQNVTGSTSGRTVYVGLGATGKSLYERTTRGSSVEHVEHVQFIYAAGAHGGNAFALRVTTTNEGTSTSSVAMKYQTFDHLGSVTSASDGRGRVVGAVGGGWANSDLLGYDPWGARRNPDGRVPAPRHDVQSKGGPSRVHRARGHLWRRPGQHEWPSLRSRHRSLPVARSTGPVRR